MFKNTESMKFLEKDLEEIIHTTDRQVLKERGLDLNGVLKRQLRIGDYGIADLVTFNKYYKLNIDTRENSDTVWSWTPTLSVTVYELKKDKLSISTLLQAVGYVKGLQKWFENRNFTNKIEFNIVLIGREIPMNGDFCFIPDVFHNVKFYRYDIDIDGLSFKEILGYHLIKQGF